MDIDVDTAFVMAQPQGQWTGLQETLQPPCNLRGANRWMGLQMKMAGSPLISRHTKTPQLSGQRGISGGRHWEPTGGLFAHTLDACSKLAACKIFSPFLTLLQVL